jgi:hypothetical protein
MRKVTPSYRTMNYAVEKKITYKHLLATIHISDGRHSEVKPLLPERYRSQKTVILTSLMKGY